VLYYRPVVLWHTSAHSSNDFILVPRSAKPDSRRQQNRIPDCAEAAEPQGNHADLFMGAGDIAPDPKRDD